MAVIIVRAPEGMPAWAVGILAVVGILLALGILWLPERLARRVNPRLSGIIMLGGIILLTIGFVVGVRVLVVALGGT